MTLRTATCLLKSASAYSQSRNFDGEVEKMADETADDFDKRTWRHKCHTTKDGRVFIPAPAFKQALDDAAQMFSKTIPGKRGQTYTKFFGSGVLVLESPMLGVTSDDAEMERVFCHANGKRGSGTRVWRRFPMFREWQAEVVFSLLSDNIPKEIFEEYLGLAGKFIGVGRFRPANRGWLGRFEVEKVTWG